MAGFNAIIHLGSLVVFAGLAYWLIVQLRQKEQLVELIKLSSDAGHNRVTVDWPERLLASLCASLGVEFSGPGSSRKAKPARIDKTRIAKALVLGGATRVSIQGNAERMKVLIDTLNSDRVPRMDGALGDNVDIEIRKNL